MLGLGLGLNRNRMVNKLLTMEFEPTRDTLAYNALPNNNYNGNNDIQLMTDSVDGLTDVMYGYMYFNFVTALTGKTIKNAEIKLYALSMDNAFNIGTKRILQSWGETTLTWNNKPTLSSAYPGTNLPSGVGWKNIDVTQLVKDVLTGSTYQGIFLYSTILNWYWCRFSARENLYMPKLIVKYK